MCVPECGATLECVHGCVGVIQIACACAQMCVCVPVSTAGGVLEEEEERASVYLRVSVRVPRAPDGPQGVSEERHRGLSDHAARRAEARCV